MPPRRVPVVSRALPGYAYGDPARIVEAQELRAKGCSVCTRGTRVFDQVLCGSGLKFPSCKRAPRNGYQLTREAGG